jgi:hypothetical protein
MATSAMAGTMNRFTFLPPWAAGFQQAADRLPTVSNGQQSATVRRCVMQAPPGQT